MRVKRQESRVESHERRFALRSSFGPRRSTLAARRSSAGLTLIELLVVIIILTTLVAAAIPMMAPANADRRLREASRGLNAFISGAQMRAVENQRPFGVGFKKLGQDTGRNEDNGTCLEVFYVEQPSPFVGFDETSAVMVALDNSATGSVGQVLVRFVRRGDNSTGDDLPTGWDEDLLPPYTIRPGDVVEVRGTRLLLTDTDWDPDTGFYTDTSGMPDGTLVTVPVNDTGQLLNVKYDRDGNELATVTPAALPYWTNPGEYKILRQPMPVGEPFQMPEGTAIDLRASGERIVIDDSKPLFQRKVEGEFGGFFHNPDILVVNERVNNPEPVIVMFSPEGSVERVKFSRSPPTNEAQYDAPVVSNIYLLVGQPEKTPLAVNLDPTLLAATYADTTDEQWLDLRESLNWLAGDSRWIVIGAQSGRVVTVENAFIDRTALEIISNPESSGELGHMRRARQIRAAREFANQMAQLGGR